MRPEYSILITNYNTINTIEESLCSILNQIDDRFEVVVVDNKSNDGSEKILREFRMQGKIKLISTKCSRGRGRQIAFENSKGETLITNMDMDVIFKHKLKELLKIYSQLDKGKEFIVAPVPIISHKIIENVGGWRDLQRDEDVELNYRLNKIGVKFIDTHIDIVVHHSLSWEHKGYWYILCDKYIFLRDKMRIGIKISKLYKDRKGSWRKSYGCFLFLILLLLAKITYKFKECYYATNKKEVQ